jgi:flagellin
MLPARTIFFDNRLGFGQSGGKLVSGPYDGPTILSTAQWSAVYDTNLSLDGSNNPSIWYQTTVASPSATSTGGLGIVADQDFNAIAAHNGGMIFNRDYFDGSGNVKSLTGDSVSFLSTANITNAINQNTINYVDLGSQLNHLDYVVDSLQTLSNNLADAQSRILDTNYAVETATLTRGQIMQQAATSMLAQANQMPNVILTLLK